MICVPFKAGLDLSLVSALFYCHNNKVIHELNGRSLNLVGEQAVHTSGLLYQQILFLACVWVEYRM